MKIVNLPVEDDNTARAEQENGHSMTKREKKQKCKFGKMDGLPLKKYLIKNKISIKV